jgi:hypothetical protein
MTRHWFEAGPEPEVFQEAQNYIGGAGFRVRGSASYASAVYSGVFCLLALGNARDWRRGENIQLQELEDHHIFPKAYLQRHAITKRVDVNTIANRTLICDETNGRIKDKAPADYLADPDIFPRGATLELLAPHFIDKTTLPLLEAGLDALTDEAAADLYERFLQARESAIIAEIRRASGTTAIPVSVLEAPSPEELAADIQAGGSPEEEEVEFEIA